MTYDKELFKKNLGHEKVQVIEQDFEITWELFYEHYPKKRNPDRAVKFWNGMTRTEKALAYRGVFGYKKYCAINTWYTPVLPERYLKERFYEEDYTK